MAENHGYGPPTVHGYSAVKTARAPETNLMAARASAPGVTITLHGEGFIQRAMPLILKVGDQAVMGNLQITPDQRHVTFRLERMPEEGAVIQAGYAGDELVELPERFSLSKVEEGNPLA
jgi:hypothetical protein